MELSAHIRRQGAHRPAPQIARAAHPARRQAAIRAAKLPDLFRCQRVASLSGWSVPDEAHLEDAFHYRGGMGTLAAWDWVTGFNDSGKL